MSPVSHRMRQTHRWLSIAFAATVVANFAAMTQGPPPAWVTFAPLLPLAVLLLTGLYLFARPYAARRRGAVRNGAAHRRPAPEPFRPLRDVPDRVNAQRSRR